MGDPSGRNPSRWERLEELFDAMLERPEAERAEWLDRVCADDPRLRAELRRLMTAHQRPAGFLDRPLAVTMATNPRELLEKSLAGRYRIVGELGRGGMAVVYLAHEHKHGRQVVLKVLRPGLASAEDIADRFSREVRIIARLAHPHLIGLIDSGEAAGLLYYVMPYVEGETLRARLLREKKLEPGAVINILSDIAAGLVYAHDHGVVHRDLKPENVLCAGQHAFLMDFGIAKILERTPGQAATTAEWVVIGTPGYMAPEQNVPGQVIDHRADIYSFGLIAKEMLTGQGPASRGSQLPSGDTLTDRSGIPPDLEKLIDHCLEFDPAARPQGAAELLRRLILMGSSGKPLAPATRQSRRVIRYVAGGAVAAAVAVTWFFRPGPNSSPLPPPIAVAAFSNQTGDSTLDIWGRMAGDWITQGLQQTGLAPVVPWPAALLASEQYDPNRQGTLVSHVRSETGAGTVITGSYYLIGDSLQFRVEASDAVQHKLIGSPPPIVVPRDSAMNAIREVRDRIMGTVGLLTNELISAASELSHRPPTFDAYVAFDQGVRTFREQQYSTAARHYARAYQLDTAFTAALLYLANAHLNEEQYARMDSVLGIVRPRLSELSEYHRYWYATLEATLAGDGQRILAAAQKTASVSPASIAWYNVGLVALRVGRVSEALAALSRVDPDRSETRGWSPYWSQLCHALHLAGDHEAELVAARQLRTRHPDRRVGLTMEARALATLGRLEELDSALAVSSTLPPTTYWSQGAAMVVAGEELLAHGNKEPGRRYLARGINWLRAELALHPADRSHRYWLGSALYDLNRWSESAAIFEKLAVEMPNRTSYRWQTGLAQLRAGVDSSEVARWLVTPSDRERGDFQVVRARVALIRGDREAALSLFADALQLGVDGLAWLHASAVRDFEMLGEVRSKMPAGFIP